MQQQGELNKGITREEEEEIKKNEEISKCHTKVVRPLGERGKANIIACKRYFPPFILAIKHNMEI